MLNGIAGRILTSILPALSDRILLPLLDLLFEEIEELVQRTDNEVDNQIFRALKGALRRLLTEGPDKVASERASTGKKSR